MANAAQGFAGVMVSSTFKDLKEHREVVLGALRKSDLHEVAMENSTAQTVGVIESSLRMVRKASAYICVIGQRYGQTLEDEERNPRNVSVTELEFDEAQRLRLPVLLFVMGDDHPLRLRDIEDDAGKREKLIAFREKAKRCAVWAEFNSLEEFVRLVCPAVADLPRQLGREVPTVEKARAFKAVPVYPVSNEFVGRKAQLDALNDWAGAADPHPVMLFDAIGGTGKSMLTWEWATKHAPKVRSDWAGRFWYSFYERGAVMADFCRQALAYMTGRPGEEFGKKGTQELSELLLGELQSRPWLLVLDGLERVLVMYHRFDAAQVTEEEANAPTDQIAHRDPCSSIRDEDDELLRRLAGEGPSKVLITSRLVPRVLLNRANQPVPGVLRFPLAGLRPVDAEELIRGLGIRGDGEAIRNYLKSNCDCHPLVIGVLAGLIQDYLPDQGNFDAWVKETSLDLGKLDLVQKRNHILLASLEALSARSRGVLATMALLPESVDYATLAELAPDGELGVTVPDLQKRGLLQYDRSTRRYDLHPVVRSVASGRLKAEETELYGQRLVDHFSSLKHDPWEEAETLEGLRPGLNLVRTLLRLGRYQAAATAYRGGLSDSLLLSLGAYAEVLMLLKPFFPQGWGKLPAQVLEGVGEDLLNDVGISLGKVGARTQSLEAAAGGLGSDLSKRAWLSSCGWLHNLSRQLPMGQRDRCALAYLELAGALGVQEEIFCGLLNRFRYLSLIGRYAEAQMLWEKLDPMGRKWSRRSYRPGWAEWDLAWSRFRQGTLEGELLILAEKLAKGGRSGEIIPNLYYLRGLWCSEKGEWNKATVCFGEAVTMDRAVGGNNSDYTTNLALAKFHLGKLLEAGMEAEHLANTKRVAHQPLAELCVAIGDCEGAKHHALEAYRSAWADGEPYVFRWELNKAKALLDKLGVEAPVLPPYDPEKDGKYPLEDEINAAIAELRAQKEKK